MSQVGGEQLEVLTQSRPIALGKVCPSIKACTMIVIPDNGTGMRCDIRIEGIW
jgi:hypothetical protein